MKEIKNFDNLSFSNVKTDSYISLNQKGIHKEIKKSKYFIKNNKNTLIIFILLISQIYYIVCKNKKINFLKEKYNELEYKLKEYKNTFERNEINYSNKLKEIEEYKQNIKILETQLKVKKDEFKQKEKKYLEIIKLNNETNYNEIIRKKKFTNLFLKKINQIYEKQGYINLNELESTFPQGRPWPKNNNTLNEINVGSSLDPLYILRAMMTTASLMDSQKNETKLRLHFAVVDNFTSENMLKVYSLREKIKENVEFNFYNAKIIEKQMKGQAADKGSGLIAKLLLPQLLKDDIEKLIIIDNGDILVLRDLTEMYNWNLNDNLYVGVPDQMIGKIGIVSKKPMNVYINTGNYLINVKKVKEKNMYEKFLKYREEYYNSNIADQDLINDLAFGEIGYLPIKFGAHPIYRNDKDSDEFVNIYKEWNFYEKIKKSDKYPNTLKNEYDLFLESYNPVIVHEIMEKWMLGKGLSIYRRIAQYYIKFAGIWDEMCEEFPGYCKI